MTSTDDDLLGLPAGLPYRATLAGVGYALPRTVYPNAYVEHALGLKDDWIESRTGVSERRWADQDETVLTLGQSAAEQALANAGLTVADIDHVIVATYTFDRITPGAAPFLTAAMGIDPSAGAIDVSAACAGWLTGLKYASAMVESGRAHHVLVVASDVISANLSHGVTNGIAVMGDGAGAGVVCRGGNGRAGTIGEILTHADGNYAELIGGHRNTERAWMKGQETYKVAVSELTNVTKEVLKICEKTKEDIDLFVFHQANSRILKAVGARLDLDGAKSVSYLSDTGNISAATIPMAMTRAQQDGKLKSGDLILTAAIGAGYVWSAGLMRWGIDEPAT